MKKAKEKQEMENVILVEGIQKLSPWKKERFCEFAIKLLVDAENEPPKQGEDKLFFEKIIVYFYADKEKSPAEQEKELIEKALFLNLLDESGAGILCCFPVYSWYDTFKGKKHILQILQQEWHGFVDIEGNFKHDLNTVSEKGLKRFFMRNPECEGRMGLAVEIIDLDDLKIFIEKLEGECLRLIHNDKTTQDKRIVRGKQAILINNRIVHIFRGKDSHPWRIFIKAYDDPKGKISLDSKDIEDIPNKTAIIHNLNKSFKKKDIPMRFIQFEGRKDIYRLIK